MSHFYRWATSDTHYAPILNIIFALVFMITMLMLALRTWQVAHLVLFGVAVGIGFALIMKQVEKLIPPRTHLRENLKRVTPYC